MIIPRISLAEIDGLDELLEQTEKWKLFGQLAWTEITASDFSFVKDALKKVGGKVDVSVHLKPFDESQAVEFLNAGSTRVIADDAPEGLAVLPDDHLFRVETDSDPDSCITKQVILQTDSPIAERLAELEMARVDCLVDTSQLSTDLIVDFFEKVLVSDRPDGLWTTVIVDPMGIALGLAYSNSESLRYAVENRVGCYWSRSRNELWVKGKSSGATQSLLSVRMDCDRDCLRFAVTQELPGFCHRQSYSCFGEERTIASVVHRLMDRIENSDEKSFTKRLVNDHAMLKSKLLEEAAELIEADQGTDDEVAWEAADVLYFTLVAMLKKGVSLDRVYHELARRMTRVVRRPAGIKKDAGLSE